MITDTPDDIPVIDDIKARPAVPKRSRAKDEIDNAIEQSAIQDQKKALRKTRIKQGGGLAGVVLLVYVIYLLFVPYKGTMAFGICKVFLELNVQYPKTLRLSTVEDLGMSVRIWYTQIDSFGEYRLEPMQCYFKEDERYGFALDKVTINRREVNPQVIESFNNILPVVFAYPPDLTLPSPLPDSLKSLQIDTDMFRKPIF